MKGIAGLRLAGCLQPLNANTRVCQNLKVGDPEGIVTSEIASL